ncbi:hypothetical protein L1987_48043 [Smallanthus sonchifolius]|uniref:Uncharacterized protein n=1 Tax=Smallanthus sonchifolius TaxID=185202 RepID=A0ACB9FQ84_9ASTR|nr:hypothetical protein L1987_48043 [Smallanthus sonchifolius]
MTDASRVDEYSGNRLLVYYNGRSKPCGFKSLLPIYPFRLTFSPNSQPFLSKPDIMSGMKKWEHLKISFADIKDATNDFGKTIGKGFGKSTVISQACGTLNYLEPEYIRTGLVNKKSDVFSFGMVLFEVLCGRLCYVRDTDGILLLADVAKEYYANDKLDSVIDPILREQMSPESLRKFSAIAYKCLQDREHRPLMGVVQKELEETLNIQVRL